jgi:hypothetical protein
MSKQDQFNSNNTEFVTQSIRPQGEFNILHGSTSLLPNELQTAQGSNGIDTPAGATFTSLSEPVNPHGVLVRNREALSGDAPAYDVDGGLIQGQYGVLNQQAAVKESRVGSTVFGVDVNGVPGVDAPDVTIARQNISLPTNQNLIADNLIPNVGSRFFR